jgi:hypothetical protein
MKLQKKDLICMNCTYETMTSGVSFLVVPCEEHNSTLFKSIFNAISVQQDLIARSQPIKQ